MIVQAPRKPRNRLVFEMRKRPDLQGMRAVAVLAVFADHLFGWPSGGFVGVDVFFVLSGYFISGLLLKERSLEGRVSFQNFYTRRAKRILPSALLVLTMTVAGAYLLFPAPRAKETLLDALWAAVFASNIRFEAVGADYFRQDLPPSPVQHYWSLSIEEQFYFVWPLLLAGIFLLTRSVYRRGHAWARQWALFVSMAVIVAVSFAWAMHLSEADPNAAYFSGFTRVWELGVGALIAIAAPWLARIPDAVRPGLAYLGLAGVAASLVLINSTSQFPAPWAALPVLSTAVVIASFHGAEVRRMQPLTNPVAQWFGDTSYTLYLWHWPVIVLLLAVIPKGPAFYAVALCVTMILTAVTYHFYENPIRKSQWLLENLDRRPRWAMPPTGWSIIGIIAVIATVTSILYVERADKLAATQRQADSLAYIDLAPPLEIGPPAVGTDSPPALPVIPGNDPCYGAPAFVNDLCALRNPEVPLTPSIETFATEEGVGVSGCWTEAKTPLKSCTFGYEGADATRIALVGDSHAGRAFQAILPYLAGEKWQLTTYIGQGCVWMSPPHEYCPAMAEIQEDLLAQRYALVLTTSTRTHGAAEYVRNWQPVAAAGSRIAVLADNPRSSEQAIACLTRVSFGDDRTGECATPRGSATPHDPQVAAGARINPPAYVIDLTPYYCTADSCPSVIGDVIVYADISSHVTPPFWSTLAPALVNGIRQALR